MRNDQKLATILDECRSQKIAPILAHQRTDQITNPTAFVRDLTPHAIALQVPYTNIENLPRMSAEQQAAIRQRMRMEYRFIPQTTDWRAAAQETPSEQPAHRKDDAQPPESVIHRPDQTATIDPAAGTHTEAATKWGK